ncbi:MAG: gamma-glutamyltransferase [Fimbriimonadaceae bacterium]|nr:gamma-glutamyltransferase [Chthonomonadaceae bacterium]MCO5296037.1 gamma-glutamyltransferase [Fimbriimonadaceae bacterium]
MLRTGLAGLLASVLIATGAAQSHPVYGRQGMAVAVDPTAASVGANILRQGGNAYDAAAAMGFALAVTYPQAGNLGGGGFAVCLSADGATSTLDFREKAPGKASKDMFLDAEGNVVPRRSLDTHLAAGVPGSVDGLLTLHARFGRLPRAQVLAPAIALASDGFPVSKELADSLRSAQKRLASHPGSLRAFYPNGAPPAFGSILRQPDLAKTLRLVSDKGRAGFYEGETADLIVAEMGRGQGLIDHDDLRAYRSKWREPFVTDAGGYRLVSMPLPSSGGVTIAQILGMLDLEEIRAFGPGSSRSIQQLTEAERLAYADRNHFLGDSDFVEVPLKRLVSPEYLAERRKQMPKERAGNSAGVAHGDAESTETTHYTVADADGNVVAITTTLNGSYGMGAAVEGAGFLLNNEMDDFTSKPGVPNLYGLVQSSANEIVPGKRMLSSMTPTIVLKDGKFFMTVGSPGGSTIITTVLQVFLNMAVHGMNIRDAIDAGRAHHQWLPDEISYERNFLAPDVVEALKAMGYKMAPTGSIGIAAGIERLADGTLAGWCDRRSGGAAVGY